MKQVTPQQVSYLLEDILADEKDKAKKLDRVLHPIASNEVSQELTRRIGEEWALTPAKSLQLTKKDIYAIAKSRFLQREGINILLVMFVILLGIATLAETIKILPVFYAYILSLVIIVVSLYIFAKKQGKACKELMNETQGIEK